MSTVHGDPSTRMQVAVTGRGLVSPIGSDFTSIPPLGSWDSDGPNSSGRHVEVIETPAGSQLRQLATGVQVPPGLTSSDPMTMASAAACSQALAEANLDDLTNTGIIFSTVVGTVARAEAFFAHVLAHGSIGLSPNLILASLPNILPANLSILFRARGGIAVVRGSNPIHLAMNWLSIDRVRNVLVVGTELPSLKAVDAILDELGRCGERNLAGVRFSEISGAVILERLDAVDARGGTAIALIDPPVLTPASSSDARELWALSEGSAVATVRAALEQGCLRAEDIAFVVSCANGTSRLDSAELAAILNVFDESATVIRPKDLFGETMGASGIVAILCSISQTRMSGQTISLVSDCQMTGEYSTVIVRCLQRSAVLA